MKQFVLFFTLAAMVHVASAQNWLITGNTGNINSNFLGTADNKFIIFKTNNIERGRLQNNGIWRFGPPGNTAAIDSTGKLLFTGTGFYQLAQNSYVFRLQDKPNYGMFFNSTLSQYELRDSLAAAVFFVNADSGHVTVKGRVVPFINNSASLGTATKNWNNIFISGSIFNGTARIFSVDSSNGSTATGSGALISNSSSGIDNTATGSGALFSNTTGAFNTATGKNALRTNTNGFFNTATGVSALEGNTTGTSNTANGEAALHTNTTGNFNTATGVSALKVNTTGSNNTATGLFALFSNTTGFANTAIGIRTLSKNISGHNLVAVGDSALFNQNGGNGFNTAIGSKALFANAIGANNTALGSNALKLSTGSNNTAIGSFALKNNTSGNTNTAVGNLALDKNVTGIRNTAIGEEANTSTSSLSNAGAFGFAAITDASNKICIGNTSVTSIGGQVGFTTFSDGRFKQNIKDETHGLDFIKLLKPVSYNYDINGIDNFWGLDQETNTDAEAKKSKDAQINNRYTGFLAQDVDKAAQSLHYNFSGIDKPADDSKSTWGLRYGDFVVPLVKAVQELSTENDVLKTDNAELKSEIQNLKSEMNSLKAVVFAGSQSAVSMQRVTINENPETASLHQNIPNPFNHTTTINYVVPQQYSFAKIVIAGKTGAVLKEVNISGGGKGSLQLDASTLAAGAYSYSLYIEGRLIDSKQMILVK
jgi:hypothetical protein